MSIKNVEREILKQENEQKKKVDVPLRKLFSTKRDKVIETTLKHAKKEKIDLEEYDVETLIDEFWNILTDDIEYVPGYVDEYVQFMEEHFYSNGKISLTKVAKYLLDKHLG